MPRLKHNEHNTRQIIRSLKESVDQVDVEVRDEEVVITQKENFAPEDNVDVSQNELLTEVESQQLENCAKNFAFVSEPVISRDKVDINVNEPSSSSTHVKNSVTIESKSASKRRHICPYCGHGCAKPSVLQKHIRAHTNERPYPCIPCGFAFKTKSNLYKHCKSRAHFMNISNNNAERSTVLTEGSADSLSSSSVTVSDDELSESNQEDDANAKISSIKPCSPLPAESSDQVAFAPHFIKTNHEISTNVATSSCEIKPIDGVQMPSSIYGTKALNLKLKIPAPDLSIQSFALNSAGSSSSSSSRSSRSPKVTSPEQLELHISKIISENAAIVETFDSLWPRRYMRQSSVGSSQNVDAEIRKNDQIKPQMIKNRRYSDNPKLLTSSSDASLDLPLSLVKQVDSVPSSPFKDCNEKRSLNFGCILSSSSSHLPIKGHKDSNQALPIKAEARRTSFAGLTSVDELMKQAPKRKSSLQFFGGQVEINDSTEPKKLKLEVDKPILGSVCQDSLLVQQMSTNPKSSVFPWMNAQIKPLSSSSQQPSSHFMVTIAKPVLNSGGTVLQVSSSGSSKNNSMCIPVVALGVPVVSARCSSPSEGDSSGRRMESYDTVILASNPVSSKSKELEFTNLPDSVDELVVDSNANYCPISMECPFPSAESNLNQPSFVLTYNKRNEDIEASSNKQWSGQVPTLTITPESPCSSPVHSNLDFSKEEESSSRNFLAPKRPNSLPLKKKAVTMKLIGTTLVSPETPRPKKRYRQLHLNGNAYTYLGLKRSTRSTWCCIYRPQPMYVHQDANSKLSMYSNWQVVSTKPEFHGLSPGRSMALYDSSPLKRHNNMSISQHDISCIVTHSSYWIYKNEKDKSEEEQQSQTKLSALNVNVSQTSELSISVPLHSPLELQGPSSKSPKLSPIQPNQMMKSPNEYSQERVKSFEPSPGCQSIQKNGSKRVRIFEGGYKCNEEYTYIRGRGRGKYVCEECGIRCKKPSMLKKHIRTHTDLRPYMCKHCSFSFKTKGNLTKHMKSKAHHKKCIGIGVIPVPTVIEDSQIDAVALAKQEELDRNRARQEEEEDDSDDDSSDEEDEDDDEESEGEKFINMSTSSIIQNEVETELPVGEIIPVSITAEQEVAKSLLHLSEAVVPPTQVLVNHIPSSLHMTSLNPGNVEPLSSTEIPLQQKLISANKQHFKEITGYEVLPYSTAVEKSSSSENISVRRQTDDFSGAPSHPSSQIEWSSLFNAQRQPKSLASWVAPRRRSVSETYKDNDRNEDTKHSKSRKYSFSYPEPLKNVIKSNVEKMNKVDSSNTQILDDSEQPMDLSITKGCSEASSMTKIPSIVATTLEQINLIHPLASHSLPPSSLGEEGKCICQICNKHFSKPSQLKLHINIHYIERPFRCESCAISFRTKGHLEKHKRSLSHYNKVNINMTFGIPTAENPRPFKCTDCKIAFRIHGHLAKHLRSKLHIMKLECLGKLPFGTYAEMERSGTNLNEIDTSDCDNFLESIQSMADKMYGKEIAAAATLNDEVAEPSKEILNNYNHS